MKHSLRHGLLGLLGFLAVLFIAGTVFDFSQTVTYAATQTVFTDGDTYTDSSTGIIYRYSDQFTKSDGTTYEGMLLYDVTDGTTSATIPKSLTVGKTTYPVYITMDTSATFDHDLKKLTIGCEYYCDCFFEHTWDNTTSYEDMDYYLFCLLPDDVTINKLTINSAFKNSLRSYTAHEYWDNSYDCWVQEDKTYPIAIKIPTGAKNVTFTKAVNYPIYYQSDSSITKITYKKKLTGKNLSDYPKALKELSLLGGASEFPICEYCSSLKKVTISSCDETVLTKDAFYGCYALSSISLPSNLKEIGAEAFENSNLTSITIPASVKTIGENAFESCSKLKKVTFEKKSLLTAISKETFLNCSALTSIEIPASVKTIGEDAFLNCSALTDVTFSQGSVLQTIRKEAFLGCSSLTGLTFPASLKNLGNNMFSFDGYQTIGIRYLAFKGTSVKLGKSFLTNLSKVTTTIVAPNGSAIQKLFQKKGYHTAPSLHLTFSSKTDYLYVGESRQISVKGSNYKSSKSSVLSVSSSGLLTAKKTGTAKITVTVNGKAVTYNYKVVERTREYVLDIICHYFVTADMTDYQKVVAADEWIASHVEYSSNSLASEQNQSSEGAFIYGTCVCAGYSEAFQKIMECYDIPCILVGSHSINHEWNMVKLGSKWYHVDTTWDDPIGWLAGDTASTKSYLLKTTSYMAQDHGSSSTWYVAIDAGIGCYASDDAIPKATSTSYDKQIRHTGYEGAVINKTTVSLNKGKKTTIKVTGTTEEVSFTSSNKSVATVSSKGVVKGVKKGSTTITVKIGSKTFKVSVTVK